MYRQNRETGKDLTRGDARHFPSFHPWKESASATGQVSVFRISKQGGNYGANITTGLENIVSQPAALDQSASSAKICRQGRVHEIFLAQLKIRIPLNPMDGTDFAAQLARIFQIRTVAEPQHHAQGPGCESDDARLCPVRQYDRQGAVANTGNTITANGGRPARVTIWKRMHRA